MKRTVRTDESDLWQNRSKFRTLAQNERERLGLSDRDYWGWLAVQIGDRWTPRSVRAYAADRNQFPGGEFIMAIAKHYGVTAESLYCPSGEERRKLERARWKVEEVVAPEPDAPGPPKNIKVEGRLAEIIAELRTLNPVALEIVWFWLQSTKEHLPKK